MSTEDLKRFEIWSIYAQPETRCHRIIYAENFKEACKIAFRGKKYFDENMLTYHGFALLDHQPELKDENFKLEN